VTDVTIPDDTYVPAGDTFTKIWRLRNAGTCTWSPEYALVFDSGNIMGGPPSVPLSANVPPGSTVDLEVDLTAPAADGTHKGNWKLRNADGLLFGIGANASKAFWVQIVVGPTPTPEPTTLDLSPSSMGGVESDGSMIAYPNVGDTSLDVGLQGFVTYDLSAIPDGATILEVKLDLGTPHDVLGDPFGDLGCLRVYQDPYGSLDGGDYTPPPVVGALWRFCSEAELDAPDQQTSAGAIAPVQNALAGDLIQLRLQFNDVETNSDGAADALRPGDPRLLITYLGP
jgi:hypothetical protein